MGTSIQRLLVMLILIDLTLGATLIFVTGNDQTNINNQAESKSLSYIQIGNEFTENFKNQTVDTQNTYITKEFGDLKFGGLEVFKIMTSGIKPEAASKCIGEDCSNPVISTIEWAIWFFIIIINLILVVEIVFLYYSKKYS